MMWPLRKRSKLRESARKVLPGAEVVNVSLLLLFFLLASTAGVRAPAPDSITLPVEVSGAAGTAVGVAVSGASEAGTPVRSLWIQVHGLAYADMVSVRVNHNLWMTLNNDTVSVAEPGRSYGGIGGGFATLELTLTLPETTILKQTNAVEFRFNRTDGVVSGFRVLAFNFLTVEGRRLLRDEAFLHEDPNSWRPPLSDPDQISAGGELWRKAPLTGSGLPNAPAIRAHCSDCHTQDGRDLKYFNYSNRSIVARSQFHGLSELEGRQIASYIRSLAVPNPGRPWNPPYQPGPGLDAQPATSWAAGAGLSWVLDTDVRTLPFIFSGRRSDGEMFVDPATFRPDANLNPRVIPLAMQLPDWNHWLPRVHPLDAWGARFESSTFAKMYADSSYAKAGDADEIGAFFDGWSKSRSKFLTPRLSSTSSKWTSELSNSFYSAQLWQLVKTWEILQRSSYSASIGSRAWPNAIPAATAPAEVHLPDGPDGMGGSALTNEYYSNAWYELQLIVNSGSHRHHGRAPIDWVYVIERFLDLQQRSGRPEPARLLVAVIKAMQSTDPAIGPTDIAEGWRPEQNIDPRIMVTHRWAPAFQLLPGDLRQEVTEGLLRAWLDKTLRFAPVAYFQRGLSGSSYRMPAESLDIAGGRVWEAAPVFEAAGVNARTTERLREWGRVYNSMAQLFHY